MNEQTKKLVKNIVMLAAVGAVIIVGYFVIKKDTVSLLVDEGTAKTAAQTLAAGFEIDRTMRELLDLKEAVADHIIIFVAKEFKDLINFSVTIFPENVGRTNPFTPTAWSLEMQALEESAVRKGTQNERTSQSAPLVPVVPVTLNTAPLDTDDGSVSVDGDNI